MPKARMLVVRRKLVREERIDDSPPRRLLADEHLDRLMRARTAQILRKTQ